MDNTLRFYRLFIVCLFVTALLPQAVRAQYTLADLEALEASRNYREFLDHARDIRPSERGAAWVNMVSEMASGFVDFNLQRRRLNRDIWLYIDQVSLWPQLQSDEFFQSKRANFLRAYLPHCLEEQKLPTELCREDVMQFWKNSPKDPDLGIWLADQNEQYKLGLESWTFLSQVGLSDLSTFYCQRPIVQRHLLARLLSPLATAEMEPKQLLDHIQKHANDTCWSLLSPALKTMMQNRYENNLSREAAYNLLAARNELSQLEEDLFLTEYILMGPVVGKTFNRAWGRVRELGQNYARRLEVLSLLQKADPLPDQLFASANQESKETIMRFFNEHFPEYFAHYAKTCLNYYQGQGIFPAGNPTIHCPDFFKQQERSPLIDQSLQIQYSGIKKN